MYFIGREQVFAQEARELLNAIPGSRSVIVYSRPDPTDRLGKDFDVQGHLDLASLRRLGIPTDADCYMCGPTGFLRDMNTCLISLGVSRGAIHQEIFGPADSIEPGVVKAEAKIPHRSVGNGPIVSFARSGLAVPWDNRFNSLLEFAEACDVPVRWSCRSGVCHMC
jgi:ferredoxin-NADP reductase